MRVLVLNSGSSSLKFQLLSMPQETVLAQGMVERIGTGDALFTMKSKGISHKEELGKAGHSESLKTIARKLLEDRELLPEAGALKVIGHRVVHGGNEFSDPTVVTSEVIEKISALSKLAPLHNPANLLGIEEAARFFPDSVQVAVFDTAFHQTLPPRAKRYAIPKRMYEEEGIQVYGFHGSSHKYVSEKVRSLAGKSEKMISLHLGSGCSATAVWNGKSIDHSLGFTPSNGLVMGSRSGDIDHGIIFYLADTLGYSLEEINSMLTKESGMLGLTGFSDLRDIQRQAEAGDPESSFALDLSVYRIKKYIGGYAAAMNGLDLLLFTAGIGEHSPLIRQKVCENMDFLGLRIDSQKNEMNNNGPRAIHADSSQVEIWVIPTNEELEIARQAYTLIA